MKDGMISPLEPEALLIVSLIIAELIGHLTEDGEVCAYSVPADPIDVDRNVIYHTGALEAVLRKMLASSRCAIAWRRRATPGP